MLLFEDERTGFRRHRAQINILVLISEAHPQKNKPGRPANKLRRTVTR